MNESIGITIVLQNNKIISVIQKHVNTSHTQITPLKKLDVMKMFKQ